MIALLINELMAEQKISKYRLSQNSGVPYSTLNDICSGKAELEKCSAETVYKIAKALGVSVETILEPCFIRRSGFELYKSNVCHRLKNLGDIEFLIETLESDEVRIFYQREWYSESLYLLAMVDYISRINNVPLCNKYNDLRMAKLSEPIYPLSVVAAAAVTNDKNIKKLAWEEAIPEFARFNIVESDVRNVI